MFYISSVKNGLYGVTDTEDNVEEFYEKRKIINIVKRGIRIYGVDKNINTERYELDVYTDGYCFKYTLLDIKDGVFNLKRDVKFKGGHYYSTFSYGTVKVGLAEFDSLSKSGSIRNLDIYNKSIINSGDTVVFGKKSGRPFLMNDNLVNKDSYTKYISVDVNSLGNFCFMFFDSDLDALRFASDNNLTVANDFFTEGSDYYWSASKELGISRMLIQCDKYISLFSCVTVDFLATLESIIEKLTGREYCFGESSKGYYNPKGRCFHFTTNKTLSFELGTSEPESKLLIDGGYDWKADLKKWGVCIVRASLHASKTYSSDILFYAG